jgi:hypothetical protein
MDSSNQHGGRAHAHHAAAPLTVQPPVTFYGIEAINARSQLRRAWTIIPNLILRVKGGAHARGQAN